MLWQISGNFETFEYFNFPVNFLENKNFFQKTGVPYLVKSAKTENAPFPYKISCQKTMLRQIKKWVQNGSITKTRVLPVTALFFWKFCFSLRSSPLMKICFDVTTTQILIFILFVNAGTLFESDFSLCVSLILFLEIFSMFSTISAKFLFLLRTPLKKLCKLFHNASTV